MTPYLVGLTRRAFEAANSHDLETLVMSDRFTAYLDIGKGRAAAERLAESRE